MTSPSAVACREGFVYGCNGCREEERGGGGLARLDACGGGCGEVVRDENTAFLVMVRRFWRCRDNIQ